MFSHKACNNNSFDKLKGLTVYYSWKLSLLIKNSQLDSKCYQQKNHIQISLETLKYTCQMNR